MAVDTANRAELIERFVHLESVDLFLQNLDEVGGQQLFLRSLLTGNPGDVSIGASELSDRLWPGEDAFMSAEARAARARGAAGAASAFAMLSTDRGRDYLARQAAHFASLAVVPESAA